MLFANNMQPDRPPSDATFITPQFYIPQLMASQRSEEYGLRALFGNNLPMKLVVDMDAFTQWSSSFVQLDRWVRVYLATTSTTLTTFFSSRVSVAYLNSQPRRNRNASYKPCQSTTVYTAAENILGYMGYLYKIKRINPIVS